MSVHTQAPASQSRSHLGRRAVHGLSQMPLSRTHAVWGPWQVLRKQPAKLDVQLPFPCQDRGPRGLQPEVHLLCSARSTRVPRTPGLSADDHKSLSPRPLFSESLLWGGMFSLVGAKSLLGGGRYGPILQMLRLGSER